MRRIVIGTTNENKVKRLKRLLKDDDLDIITLSELNIDVKDPEETALTCVSIAAEKAIHYVSHLPLETIILTQDDTMVFEGVALEDNPGVHIKEPVMKKYGKFDDETAVKYYIDLANKYGGTIPVTFHYGHALAVILDDERHTLKIVSGESKLESRLVNKVTKLEKSPGYFLSAIMEVKLDGEWISHNDLTEEQAKKIDIDLYNSITSLIEKISK